MEKQLMNSAISGLKKVPKTKYFGPVKKINIDNPAEVQQHIESLKRFVRSLESNPYESIEQVAREINSNPELSRLYKEYLEKEYSKAQSAYFFGGTGLR